MRHPAPQHGPQGWAQRAPQPGSAARRTTGQAHPAPPPAAELHPESGPTCRTAPAPPLTRSDAQAQTKVSELSCEPLRALETPGTPTLTVCSRMAGLVSRKPCTTWGKICVLTVGSSRYWINCSICGPVGVKTQSAPPCLTMATGPFRGLVNPLHRHWPARWFS